MALESHNKTVATVARTEEAAAVALAKKGALSGAGSLYSTIVDLRPVLMLAEQTAKVRVLPWPAPDASALESEAIEPLLRPPLT